MLVDNINDVIGRALARIRVLSGKIPDTEKYKSALITNRAHLEHGKPYSEQSKISVCEIKKLFRLAADALQEFNRYTPAEIPFHYAARCVRDRETARELLRDLQSVVRELCSTDNFSGLPSVFEKADALHRNTAALYHDLKFDLSGNTGHERAGSRDTLSAARLSLLDTAVQSFGVALYLADRHKSNPPALAPA